MNLKNHIEWNEWLIQYLLQQGIEMFDWKAAHKAEQERISKMTLEEELERAVREFEALYGVDEDDYEDFSDFGDDDFDFEED